MGKKRSEADLISEPVVFSESGGKYENPEVFSIIVEGRNENKTFSEIADILRARGYDSISPGKVSELHAKAIAKSTLIHNTAQEKFQDFSAELEKMYSNAVKVLSRHIDILDKIYDEFETSDMETMQKYLMYIKLAPQIKMTADTILNYLKEYKDQQDKIITSKESMIWNEGQILEKVNQYMPILLKDMEKSGKIKIIDATVIK